MKNRQMPKDDLEYLFKSAETEKRVPLSTGAWNRLDDLLESDQRNSRSSRFRFISIAASLAILVSAVAICYNYNQNSEYQMEQLVIDKNEILYSSSEVAQLNIQHQSQTLQKLKPFYNDKGEVRVTMN